MKYLALKSSVAGANSYSNQLIDYAISKLGQNVEVLDLAKKPLPIFDEVAAKAWYNAPETEQEKSILALSDALIAKVKEVDHLIIGAPMYNFGIPVQLKSYFDLIARPNITFRYTAQGLEGLVQGKKATVIVSAGGVYDESNLVTQYVRTFLGFIGITDVQFVYVQGVGAGGEVAQKAVKDAQAKLDSIFA